MDRWRLPGPAGFLDQILTELRQGSSIVVGAPSCVAPALQAVLEDRIAEDWRLTELYEPVTDSPIDQLYDRLDIRDGRTIGRTVASLVEDIKKKQVVFVCGLNSSHWTAWDESLPCAADDLEWVQRALKAKSSRITARDLATKLGEDEEDKASSKALTLNVEAFLKS